MQLLSPAAQIAFSFAGCEAKGLGCPEIDVEHLFLGLCKVEDARLLKEEDSPTLDRTDVEKASNEIQGFMALLEQKGLNAKKARRRLRKILQESQQKKSEYTGHRTPRCREVFELAQELCAAEYGQTITLKYLFYAVLTQESPSLDSLLGDLSVDKIRLWEGEAYKKAKDIKLQKKQLERKQREGEKKAEISWLDKFGRDLTKLAREGKLKGPVGRKEELRRIGQTLIQKKKSNVILLGDAGVGKTCLVEGFALKAADLLAPSKIRNLRIVELSLGSLVAGTKYRGEFEERLDHLIKEASSDSNVVLFIDEIHMMVGAGSVGDSAMDAANILKPALASGAIRVIGATTTADYHRYIEKDPALQRRFQILWIEEPEREEAVEILKGMKPDFEKHYHVRIPDDVVERCVELSMRYLPEFRLPDKAIDIFDQACAGKALRTISPSGSEDEAFVTEITIQDVARVITERCRIPLEALTIDERERLLNMEQFLVQRVLGQDHAIKQVAETIRAGKAGLKDPKKPTAVFLFSGATGTGKTELAKALAEFLLHDENELVVFDMSEYQEKHSVAKLLGAPPGYVGYEREGLLAARVRNRPYSVILFDEIEKAHPEIFDVFLQIFDEGRVTDAHGRRINFSEAVIVLTSNLGSNLASRKPIGFDPKIDSDSFVESQSGEKKEYEKRINEAMRNAFLPEFVNRIQKKIVFYPLRKDTVREILKKTMRNLNQRLVPSGIEVVLSDQAISFLINEGYSAEYGAREINRTLERHVWEPVGQMILRQQVKSGQIVHATASGDKIHLDVRNRND